VVIAIVVVVMITIAVAVVIVRAIGHAVVTIPPLVACAVAMLVLDHASGHQAQSRYGD
jgi:hypothetical protein